MISKATETNIENIISNMMDKILDKRINKEPFNPAEIQTKNPFGFNLVPIEIWKSSKFERSFVTSLGQVGWEKIAREIAAGTGATAINQYSETITINTYRKEKIDEILSEQRASHRTPNWNLELNEILSLSNNRYEDLKVVYDLYVQRPNGVEEFYSIKTVKPNLDQAEIAKKSMLYIRAVRECEVYFGLPYNPAGTHGDYRKIHSMPYKIFDMDNDPSVLIGPYFWNKIGQDTNTYTELLTIFNRVGHYYSRKIRHDYLGL